MFAMLESVGSDDERAELSEEELQSEENYQFAAISEATTGPIEKPTDRDIFNRERELLEKMATIASESRSLPDARIRKLIQWIRENQCPELPEPGQTAGKSVKWKDTRIIIFTEYDDTKRYIEASTILSAEDKHQIYEANTRRVFSRLDARLKAKGQ